MRKRLLLGGLIHRLPQNAMSRTVGRITASRFSRMAIRQYIRYYNIDVSCLEKPVEQYRTLKEFFTRRLKPDARPIETAPDVVVSPVDGTVSQIGDVEQGTLIQAKGKLYRVAELLGNDLSAAERYCGGHFVTLYLSPRDYHRIHMPVNGQLVKYTYLPGRLYPVNRLGVEHVDKLFARNERLITYIESDQFGCVAVVKVGALFVGSVKVTYTTATTNVKHGRHRCERIPSAPQYEKGQELGWFEFGSTVILLFEKGKISWDPSLQKGSKVLMGQRIAWKRKEANRV